MHWLNEKDTLRPQSSTKDNNRLIYDMQIYNYHHFICLYVFIW